MAPITVRRTKHGEFEVVDADGLVLTTPLLGQNSSAAIACVLDGYARRGDVCLLHLTETVRGRCLGCVEGWGRNLISAVPW